MLLRDLNACRVWKLSDGSCVVRKGHTKDILDVALSADGLTCASASEDKTARCVGCCNPRVQLLCL